MRIVLDARTISDHFPGIGRYTYHLAAALAPQVAAQGGELILVYNPALTNTQYDLPALAAQPGVRLALTHARPFTLAEQVLLARDLDALAGDVVHCPYYLLPYALKGPLVLTVHDTIPLRFPHYFKAHQRWVYRVATALAVRRAARVICVSDATRADLCAAFALAPTRATVVYEAPGERFQPCGAEEVARVRAAYGLPERYFLYLGMNKPHKNLPYLVDAYAQVLDAPPLVLAGRADARYPQARARATRLGLEGRVLFPGAIADADLPGLYSGALAFVFVSLYEGFGLPPLEAMACGAPVIASTTPSLHEVLAPAALFVDAQVRGELARALEQVAADEALRADLRARGLAHAAQFTWARAAAETLAVYQAAVA